MAKPLVERAPVFDMKDVDYTSLSAFLSIYNETDEKGRYLHWDKLKWRVPKADAESIWKAVKFKRFMLRKPVDLLDDNKKQFSYCTPSAIEAKLHQIVKIAGGNVGSVAEGVASDGVQLKFLVSSLLMEEAITSAQLEGASTTRAVAKKMLEDDRAPDNDDERMILNNYLLLREAEKRAGDELTLDLVLSFHEIATWGTTENDVVPGEFRSSNDIFVEDARGERVHTPPDYQAIEARLLLLCRFANAEHTGLEGKAFIAPVIKAIILHFMIGYEHPFRDGNGRTARALFYWFMLKHDYNLFKYVSISKLLKDDPKAYGLSFMYTERDDNDLTYFIDYQLDIILASFEELQRYLSRKTQEFYAVVEILDDSTLSHALSFVQKDLIKKGIKEPGRIFTVKEVSSSYSLSENTARTHLNKMVKLKLLLETKEGRTVLYVSPSDLMTRLKV